MNKSKVSVALGQNTSLANKFGVTKTLNDKKQSPTKSIGFNPNLNIEDEYIENLLKQSHFMSLQIKLIKEKMKESQGNGLWGLINRTKDPYVKNIVESSQKYQQMKKKIDYLLNTMNKQNVYLTNDQTALIRLLNFLEDRHQLIEKKTQELKLQYNQSHKSITQKIADDNQRIKGILSQRLIIKKKHMQMNSQYEKNITESQRDKLKTQHQLGRIRNDQIIEQILIEEKQNIIDETKIKIQQLKDKFQQNIQYQKAKLEKQQLKIKIAQLKKNIANANFDILQIKQSLRLAVSETQKQVKQRKIITQEYQSLKVMLSQIMILNMIRKQKQLTQKKKQSAELCKAQQQTVKLERNLQDIKRKLAKSQQAQKNVKLQIDTYQTQLNKLKSKHEQYDKLNQKIVNHNQVQQNKLIELTNKFRILNDAFEKISAEQYTTLTDHFDLQRKMQNLRGRRDFLFQNLNIRDTLNSVKLEQLQKVVQKNQDLNQTVCTLMSKWQQVRNFSKL